jgi:hypothetical protein
VVEGDVREKRLANLDDEKGREREDEGSRLIYPVTEKI